MGITWSCRGYTRSIEGYYKEWGSQSLPGFPPKQGFVAGNGLQVPGYNSMSVRFYFFLRFLIVRTPIRLNCTFSSPQAFNPNSCAGTEFVLKIH